MEQEGFRQDQQDKQDGYLVHPKKNKDLAENSYSAVSWAIQCKEPLFHLKKATQKWAAFGGYKQAFCLLKLGLVLD